MLGEQGMIMTLNYRDGSMWFLLLFYIFLLLDRRISVGQVSQNFNISQRRAWNRLDCSFSLTATLFTPV